MLPLANRLRSGRDIRRVFSRGRSCAGPLLVIHAAPNRSGAMRFGFSISRKVGGAVVRNRIRRRLREACRQRVSGLTADRDVMLVVRKPSAVADGPELLAALDDLLRRAGLVLPE